MCNETECDTLNGSGACRYANGSRYEGDFRNGKRNGWGILTFSSGGRHNGEFRDGKRDGYGVSTSADGSRFQGDFRDDKPNGYGMLVTSEGLTYIGKWIDGHFQQDPREAWTAIKEIARQFHVHGDALCDSSLRKPFAE